MEDLNNMFQINSEEVISYRKNHKNIIIIDNPEAIQDLCVIYFSSNEIYYPNTIKSFRNSIVTKNKFEWKNSIFPNAKKHIFVRDLQKQWYIEGVNDELNTIEKLATELKILSKGLEIYIIGSSAGGFAAILIGSLISATKVYAFNAQLNLHLIMAKSNKYTDPSLFKYLQNSEVSKYYDLSNFLNTTTKYYYFQSCKSIMDIEQYNSVSKKELLRKISFKTSNHGFPFMRFDIQYIFNLMDEDLEKMVKKTYHPLLFSIEINGYTKTFKNVFFSFKNRLLKKITEFKNRRNNI